MSGFQADDYVEVAERIRLFYERFPKGSLQTWAEPQLFHVGDKTFVAYAAAAYRDPEDHRPGIGWAWEPIPGPTPFTRDSELQNAETSAWGRAIVAVGFETKKIASKDEVRNRQQPARLTPGQRDTIDQILGELRDEFPPPGDSESWHAHAVHAVQVSYGVGAIPGLTVEQADKFIDVMRARQRILRKQAAADPDQSPFQAPTAPADQPLPPPVGADLIQDGQRGRLHAMFRARGADRAERLQWCAELVGHPVPSMSMLTQDEADAVEKELIRAWPVHETT